MASSAGKLAIAIYILSNISRGKDNQTIKFAHIKQHEKDFLKKSYPNWGGETSQTLF